MIRNLFIAILMMLMAEAASAESFTTQTSFYTNVETKNRRCADGKWHDLSKELTAASWDYPLGTLIRITNQRNDRQVVAIVCDRGPAKRLCKAGRRLDISKAAFEVIEDTSRGLAEVFVEVII